MVRQAVTAIVCMALLGACHSGAVGGGTAAPEKNRADIPEKYRWAPEHIYATVNDFETDFSIAQNLVTQVKGFAGSLGSKEQARVALKTYFEAMRLLYNLDTYAGRVRDSDMNNQEAQKLSGRVETLFTQFTAASSYLYPEIQALPDETIRDYLTDPAFNDYRRFIGEARRWKLHTLTPAEEKILAEFFGVGYAPYESYTVFTTADMVRPSFTFSDGTTVRLDDPTYVKYRSMYDTADRARLFEAFWDNYGRYRNTFAKMLTYQTKYYWTDARLRKFNSSLEKKLFEKELPPDFYDNLVAHIRAILPALHEYMALKREILGVDKVRFPDLYVPLTRVQTKEVYPYEKAAETIMRAVEAMPDEFKTAMQQGMTPGSGWIDIYPAKGKADGGYCAGGAYAVHPYILLNWTDDYDSLTTLAHEMGHAMHSYFSNKYQPFPTSDYNLFVAEVASVFNEQMLSAYLLKNAKNTEEKIFFLNQFIETLRGTVFRQTLFAEFEKRFYDIVEKGSPLTPDVLNALYKEINHDYYGAAKGLYEMEDRYAVEWSYIPHFYYNYYVFQYVVGFVGSLTLATKILDGSLPAQQYVENLLMAGGSRPPLEILRAAGVDLMSDEPYLLAEKVFRERLAELRSLLVVQKNAAEKK